jgi:hypothetical protein
MAITNTALAQAMSDLIAHWQDFQDEMQAWLSGEVGGGPNSDGKYPITDYLDVTTLVTSPAQLEDDVQSLVSGAQGYATAASASATAAAASATTATTQAGLAATARTNAETAETNAETAQAAAESARNTAIAQAAAASTSASNALASENAAELAETNAEAAEVAAEAAQAAAEAAAAAAATFTPALYAALADDELVTGGYRFDKAASTTLPAIRIGTATATTVACDFSIVRAGAVREHLLNSSDSVEAMRGVTTVEGYIGTRSNSAFSIYTNNAVRASIKNDGEFEVYGTLELNSTLPILRMFQTGGGSNAKNWLWYASSDQLILATASDASPGAAAASYMTFTRSGTSPGTVTIAGSTVISAVGSTGVVRGGTYTPTGGLATNLAAITPQLAHWTRVGNTVTVSGRVTLDPTAGGATQTQFTLTLPIASDFANADDLCGVVTLLSGTTSASGVLVANTSTNLCVGNYVSNSTAAEDWCYTYSYIVR